MQDGVGQRGFVVGVDTPHHLRLGVSFLGRIPRQDFKGMLHGRIPRQGFKGILQRNISTAGSQGKIFQGRNFKEGFQRKMSKEDFREFKEGFPKKGVKEGRKFYINISINININMHTHTHT